MVLKLKDRISGFYWKRIRKLLIYFAVNQHFGQTFLTYPFSSDRLWQKDFIHIIMLKYFSTVYDL